MQHLTTGELAGILALSEMGWGSLLHTYKVPLSGTLLTCNQIFLLSLSGRKCFRISLIAALFKGLSASGKKLTPMIAIAVQGLLFQAGIFLFGPSLVGRLAGAVLASLWGVVQPFLIYFIIFGEGFFQFVFQWGLLTAILTLWTALKIVLGIASTLSVDLLSKERIEKLLKMTSGSPHFQKSHFGSIWKGAFKDLTRPLFLSALLFNTVAIWMQMQDLQQLILHFLRVLLIGYLCFVLLRSNIKTFLTEIMSRYCSKEFERDFQQALKAIQAHQRDLPPLKPQHQAELHSGQRKYPSPFSGS